jgi:hypothetical protein
LREKGCRVLGIGQKGKTGEESIGVYDAFVDLQHRAAARAPTPPSGRPARSTRARQRPPAPPPLPDEVERVLAAIPELRDGAPFELRHAAERLRSAGLLANSAPSTKLFRKHPEFFALAQLPAA